MVVNDFQNLDLVRSGDGLGKLVVVHEDELAVHFLEEVGLGQDAHGAAGLIQHGESLEDGRGRDGLHLGEGFVLAEGEEVLVEHVAHGNRATAEHGGGGGVVRREDEADFVLLRSLDGLRLHLQATRDDDQPHALADGDVLDVPAVAHNNDKLLMRVAGEAFGEGFQAHRADHQDEVFLAVRLDGEKHFAIERAGEVADGGDDPARIEEAGAGREEELAQLEEGEQAAAGAILVEHGQHADVAVVHDAQRLGDGRGGGDRDDIGLHHVADFGGHVRDEARRRDEERLENEINAVVGVATPRGLDVAHAGAALELGVADGRANGVRVRIAVADNENITHGCAARTPRRDCNTGRTAVSQC